MDGLYSTDCPAEFQAVGPALKKHPTVMIHGCYC